MVTSPMVTPSHSQQANGQLKYSPPTVHAGPEPRGQGCWGPKTVLLPWGGSPPTLPLAPAWTNVGEPVLRCGASEEVSGQRPESALTWQGRT